MRRLLLALTLALNVGTAAVGSAQTGNSVFPASWIFRNNFSVPDGPAYLMLGIQPQDILRPETPRDLTLALSKFTAEDLSFALPRAIALEFSPLLLAAPDSLTLTEYRKKKIWYASRLSMATLRDSLTGAPTRIAGGFRLNLVDERTIGTDQDYESSLQVTELTAQILELRTRAVDRSRVEAFARIDNEVQAQVDDGALTPAQADVEKRNRKRQWRTEHQHDAPRQTTEEDEKIANLAKEIRRRFAARYWNATVLDVAAGVRGRSPDSTGRGMKLDALALWVSYALKAGSSSQLVLGVKAGSERDSLHDALRSNLSAGIRYYLGSANAKAFADAQVSMVEESKGESILTGGLEMTLANVLWLDFNVGRRQVSGQPAEVITNFQFKTGLPGF
jgi:hypothetical protein